MLIRPAVVAALATLACLTANATPYYATTDNFDSTATSIGVPAGFLGNTDGKLNVLGPTLDDVYPGHGNYIDLGPGGAINISFAAFTVPETFSFELAGDHTQTIFDEIAITTHGSAGDQTFDVMIASDAPFRPWSLVIGKTGEYTGITIQKAGLLGALFDDEKLTALVAVPEPGDGLLLAVGLVPLALRVRRRA